jgi:hypothetical protein
MNLNENNKIDNFNELKNKNDNVLRAFNSTSEAHASVNSVLVNSSESLKDCLDKNQVNKKYVEDLNNAIINYVEGGTISSISQHLPEDIKDSIRKLHENSLKKELMWRAEADLAKKNHDALVTAKQRELNIWRCVGGVCSIVAIGALAAIVKNKNTSNNTSDKTDMDIKEERVGSISVFKNTFSLLWKKWD